MANALFKVGDDIEAVVPAPRLVLRRGPRRRPAGPGLGCVPSSPGTRTCEPGTVTRRGRARVLNHAAATKATIELVDRIPGCRGINAGTLSAAAAIEAFTAVLIGVNIRSRSHASIRLTGLRTGSL